MGGALEASPLQHLSLRVPCSQTVSSVCSWVTRSLVSLKMYLVYLFVAALELSTAIFYQDPTYRFFNLIFID